MTTTKTETIEGTVTEYVTAVIGGQLFGLPISRVQDVFMPEAILLDWNMPVIDGFQFLGHLRRMPGGETPKVVFCTTETSIDHISRAIDGGANEYIMKPFDKGIVTAKFQEVGLIELTEPTI